jgi:hypothetical protein
MEDLKKLAELIHKRNEVSAEITKIIGRPAQIGHLGEYIASRSLDIRLEISAVNKGFDGRFSKGPLAGKTVDVKWYAKKQGIVDLRLEDLPDYYLVLTGPHSTQLSSRGDDRLWSIDSVYLFDAPTLVDRLKGRGLKVGIAASVSKEFWEEAEIYPQNKSQRLVLDVQQRQMLAMFAKK